MASFPSVWQSHGKKLSLSSSLGGAILHSLTELEINPEGELSSNLRRFGALKLISLSSK